MNVVIQLSRIKGSRMKRDGMNIAIDVCGDNRSEGIIRCISLVKYRGVLSYNLAGEVSSSEVARCRTRLRLMCLALVAPNVLFQSSD